MSEKVNGINSGGKKKKKKGVVLMNGRGCVAFVLHYNEISPTVPLFFCYISKSLTLF